MMFAYRCPKCRGKVIYSPHDSLTNLVCTEARCIAFRPRRIKIGAFEGTESVREQIALERAPRFDIIPLPISEMWSWYQ